MAAFYYIFHLLSAACYLLTSYSAASGCLLSEHILPPLLHFFYQHISYGMLFHIVISMLEDTCYLSCRRVLCNDFFVNHGYIHSFFWNVAFLFLLFFFACMSLSEHYYYSHFICPLQNYLQVTGDSNELVFRGFWEAYLKAACMPICLTLSTRRSNWVKLNLTH